MRQINTHYPLLLWMLTILIAPLIFVIIAILKGDIVTGDLSLIFVFILFGAFFSLPTLAAVYLAFFLLNGKTSRFVLVAILNMISITGVFITFYVMGGSASLEFCLIYSASVIFASLICSLGIKLFRTTKNSVNN